MHRFERPETRCDERKDTANSVLVLCNKPPQAAGMLRRRLATAQYGARVAPEQLSEKWIIQTPMDLPLAAAARPIELH